MRMRRDSPQTLQLRVALPRSVTVHRPHPSPPHTHPLPCASPTRANRRFQSSVCLGYIGAPPPSPVCHTLPPTLGRATRPSLISVLQCMGAWADTAINRRHRAQSTASESVSACFTEDATGRWSPSTKGYWESMANRLSKPKASPAICERGTQGSGEWGRDGVCVWGEGCFTANTMTYIDDTCG
jgi:hypothetical protein